MTKEEVLPSLKMFEKDLEQYLPYFGVTSQVGIAIM